VVVHAREEVDFNRKRFAIQGVQRVGGAACQTCLTLLTRLRRRCAFGAEENTFCFFPLGKFLTSISSSLREQFKSFVDGCVFFGWFTELAAESSHGQIADYAVKRASHSPTNQNSPSRSSFLTIRSSTKSSVLRRANFSLVRVSTRMLLRIPSMLVYIRRVYILRMNS
jgi:hypothetical protein